MLFIAFEISDHQTTTAAIQLARVVIASGDANYEDHPDDGDLTAHAGDAIYETLHVHAGEAP